MAPALPWLSAAVVWAMGVSAGVVSSAPRPALVETIVGEVVDGTARVLAARRGLAAGRSLTVRIVDRARMRASLAALLPAPRTAAEQRDEAALYERLGLPMPASPPPDGAPSPPSSSSSSPSSSPGWPSVDVSGLYEVTGRRLLIGNWIDLGASTFALSRDVAQALLDRRFGLPRWLKAAPAPGRPAQGDSDALLARLALVEGDAITQALEKLDPEGVLPPPRALAELAERTRAAIAGEQAGGSALELERRLFVELDGLTFVARVRGQAPWSAVDAIWRQPPQSSEQVLHPQKYDRREPPDNVGARLPLQLRGGWRASYRDTLGELGVRVFLARAVDDYRAERAAAGWGGDRALLVRRQGNGRQASAADGSFAAWITTWDDDTDAEDFAAEATSALSSLVRSPAAEATPASGRVRIVDDQGRLTVLERRRNTVGMLVAAPPDAQAVLSQLMDAAARRAVAPRSARRHAGRARSR